MSRPQLTDTEELLHRHVHPQFDRDGQLTSQIFFTRAQPAEVSVNRGSMLTQEASYELACQMGTPPTCGCCSVSVGECDSLSLQAWEDPIDENPAHAVIDMDHLNRKARETAAKQLLNFARERWRRFT